MAKTQTLVQQKLCKKTYFYTFVLIYGSKFKKTLLFHFQKNWIF